jgi:chromosome segregation ATPase
MVNTQKARDQAEKKVTEEKDLQLKELRDEIETLKNESRKSQALVKDLNQKNSSEISKLESEVKLLSEKNQDYASKVRVASEEANMLKGRIFELETKLSNEQNEKKNMASVLQKSNDALASLEAEKQRTKFEAMKNLEIRDTEYHEKAELLKKIEEEQTQQNLTLKTKLDESQAKNEELRSELDSLNADLSALRSQLEFVKSSSLEQEEQHKKYHGESELLVSSLKSTNQKLSRDIENHVEEIRYLNEKLANCDAEKAKNANSLANALQDFANLKDSNVLIIHELEDLKEKRSILNLKLEESESQLFQAHKSSEEKIHELSIANETIESMKEELSSLIAFKKEMSEKEGQESIELDKYRDEIKSLKEGKSKLESKLAHLEKSKDRVEKELERIQIVVGEMELKLVNTKVELVNTVDRLNSIEDENNKLKSSLKSPSKKK